MPDLYLRTASAVIRVFVVHTLVNNTCWIVHGSNDGAPKRQCYWFSAHVSFSGNLCLDHVLNTSCRGVLHSILTRGDPGSHLATLLLENAARTRDPLEGKVADDEIWDTLFAAAIFTLVAAEGSKECTSDFAYSYLCDECE